MENKIIFLILLLALVGCGSTPSSAPVPAAIPSESPPVSKTIIFQPNWPEALQPMVSELKLEATLKTSDAQGKAVGALGPVAAQTSGNAYQFVFSEVPSTLSDTATVSVVVSKLAKNLSAECLSVGKASASLVFKNNEATWSPSPTSLDTHIDCDGDGLTNLEEFQKGLKVDNADSDGDGVGDAKDIFPLDSLESADADGEGIGDNVDNCPSIVNADQSDFDNDKIGDACDPDIDGDGISNIAEGVMALNPYSVDTDGDGVADNVDVWPTDKTKATDPDNDGIPDDHNQDNCPMVFNPDQKDFDGDHIGDACDPDVDGDGVANAQDNCPLISNSNQYDADHDEVGDLCDCAPNDWRIYQGAVDDPDSNHFDSNCDGIDGDKNRAIFVSVDSGKNTNSGAWDAPLQSLGSGLEKAKAEGKDLYIGRGTYLLDDIIWSGKLRLFGTNDPNFETIFINHKSDTTLLIQNPSADLLFDGILFKNDQLEKDPLVGSRTVVVENGKVQFVNNTIKGGTLGTHTTAVVVSGNSQVTLDNNWIDGGSGSDTSSGVLIDAADTVRVTNNVIRGGLGRFVIGLDIVGASPTIRNNTIDTTSHNPFLSVATVQTIRFENALGLTLESNIFITGAAANQYVMVCSGLEPSYPDRIHSNLLAPFSIGSPVARVAGCQGGFDFDANDGLNLGFTTAQNNFDYAGVSLSALLDTETYHVRDTDYQDKGASR